MGACTSAPTSSVNIDPFTIDSLDNTSTEGLVFGGQLCTSAGIFPVKRQDIRVQRDYSLGFTEETGPEGWRAYQGAGQAQGKVQLSIAGLRVDGDLVYQQSRGHSSEFVLFPDSARGQGQYALAGGGGATAKGVGIRPPNGSDASMHWLPYQKDLVVAEPMSQAFSDVPGTSRWPRRGGLTYPAG